MLNKKQAVKNIEKAYQQAQKANRGYWLNLPVDESMLTIDQLIATQGKDYSEPKFIAVCAEYKKAVVALKWAFLFDYKGFREVISKFQS